jgi:signal transduction histidine kinase/ActR/RegA family two-component response regulator
MAETWSVRQAALEVGSEAWYEAGLERVEAELEFDARRARTTAEELARTAQEAGESIVGVVATELAALASAVLADPARVAEASTRLPNEASPILRASFHLARARRLWLADRPTDVLADTLASLAAARASGSPAAILRAAWFLHDITEDEALALDAAVLEEIERHSRSEAAPAFEALRRMTEYWRSWSTLSNEGRHAALDAAAKAAEAVGDVRGKIQVSWDRSVLASEGGDLVRATELLEHARTLAAAAGFRREEAVSLQILADFALSSGDPELARASLEESAELVAGSGLFDPEIRQAHLELRLASASGDAEGVVTWTKRLEELRRTSDANRENYAEVRQQLFAAELARVGAEQRAAAAQARTRRLIAGAFAVSLLLIALIAAFGRRRLARVNSRLREEMQRAESESRARAELEQRMRLVERAESLGMIASGIAHDFNNLMTGVLGNSELLRLRHHDAESRRRLDAIADSVERGSRLCRQLQAYAGGQPSPYEPLELGALLAGLEPALQAAAGPGMELTFQREAGELSTEADRSQLEQALLNLVTNARDARARHVRIGVRRERRTAEDWKREFHRGDAVAGEYFVFQVQDDGEGLSAELLERIFDPFFTTRFPGRGLGLAVVLGAVRRHLGAIGVTSRPGAGATFRMYLPVLANDSERVVLRPQPAERKLATTRTPLQVLVVDDEPQVCEYVRVLLEARGHRVLTTQDGTRALELAHDLRGEQRVALIDLTMPVTDGRDVVRALRTSADTPALVLMSGHSATHLTETARELAADGWIAKPFLSDALEAALVEALEKQRGRTPSAFVSVT